MGLIAALLLLTLLVAVPPSGEAETPSLKRKLAGEVLVPFQPEVLSGRAWLVTTGQDPGASLKAGSPRDEAGGGARFQAPGAAAAALIPYRDPSAKFSRTILFSRDLGRLPFQTEPHLAVNPKDPNHVVAGVIDYNFPGIVTYVSIDGGANWEGPFQPKFPRRDQAAAGDPTIAFDRAGNLYAAQLSIDVMDFRLGPVVGQAVVNNVSVSPSKDGGFSWLEPVRASQGEVLSRPLPSAAGQPPRGEVEVNTADKPWLSLGPHWEKPDREVIYVTYTTFLERWQLIWSDEVPVLNLFEEEIVIELVRSEDGGQTWSRPVEVSPRVRFQAGEEGQRRVVQGAQPAVAPDGTLYVAWFDSAEDGPFEGLGAIWVVSSRDGGRTFSRPRQAASLLETNARARSASFRLWATGFPQMAIGSGGELYIAYTGRPVDNPEDDGDVFLVRSADGGRNWERPVRVNDDGSGRLQFFPALAVDPKGNLHMMWADTRDDRGELSYHIYYSTSGDGGVTWERNSRVSDFPSNPNYAFSRGLFIGDYFAIKATAEDVYMVWADSRLGQLGGVNQKIGFARKRLMPSPSVFLSPPSGPSGRDVVVQGHNFQPDSELFVEMGGVVIAAGRSGEDGTFSLRLFVPIAGEGASPVRVMDSSGNVASASFYTEFGFDSFQKAVSRLEERVDKMGREGLPSPAPVKGSGGPPWEPGWLWATIFLAIGVAVGVLATLASSRFRKR